MIVTEPPSISTLAPVIYVHARGCEPVNDAQLQALLGLGSPVCSRLAHDELEQTTHGFDQPGKLLAELANRYPDRPVVFLRAGIQPSKHQIEQLLVLLEQADQPLALTLLSNAETTVNPFAGLSGPESISGKDSGRLVDLLAPGHIHRLETWTDHFVILSPGLVGLLSATPPGSTLMQQVLAAGGALKVPDQLFLHDSRHKIFEPVKLQPHESGYPPAFSELSARLQAWFDSGNPAIPFTLPDQKPACLHITHSWGGGVAQWLNSLSQQMVRTGISNSAPRIQNPDSGTGRN